MQFIMQFRQIKLEDIDFIIEIFPCATEITNKVIFDGRNLFEVAKMKELGYHYVSIGRSSSNEIKL